MSRNKKQLDKESMFKKIMPSVAEDAPRDTEALNAPSEIEPLGATAAVPAIPPLPPLPTAQAGIPQMQAADETAPAFVCAVQPQEHKEPQPVHSVPTSEQPATVPASGQEETEAQPQLVNLMRTALEHRLSDALTKFHCCDCEQCRLDVLAIALNKVKPHYILLEPTQDALAYITADISRDAVTALVQAIMVVKAHPRH